MRHGRGLCAFFSAWLLTLAVAGEAAAQFMDLEVYLGAPEVDYSADMTITSERDTVRGRVYRAGRKERREIDTEKGTAVMIMLLDRRVALQLLPAMGVYRELSMDDPRFKGLKVMPGRRDIRIDDRGTERLDGVPLRRKHVSGADGDGNPFEGDFWLTEDGIVVRAVGSRLEGGVRKGGAVALANIRRGPLEPSLFEVPPGYRPMPSLNAGAAPPPPPDAALPTPTLPGGAIPPTMGMPRLRPEQVDAMSELMRRQGASEADIERFREAQETMGRPPGQ